MSVKQIPTALQNYEDYVKNNDGLVMDRQGKLSVEGFKERLVRVIFRREGVIENLAKMCIQFIDNLEGTKGTCKTKVFEAIQQELSKIKSKKAQETLSQLGVRILGIKYREKDIPKDNADTDEVDIEQVHELAKAWKEEELYEDKELTQSEIDKLDQLNDYPKFVKELKENSDLQTRFFKWALRENNSIEAFVKFPATCFKINKCLLSLRTGYFASTSLKVEGDDDLTLPFEVEKNGKVKSKRFSILDGSGNTDINFRLGYKATINEVFQVFKQKKYECGDFEYCAKNGITNFNVHKLGPRIGGLGKVVKHQRIILNDEFWKQLPEPEKLNRSQMKKSLNLQSLRNNQWVAIVRATKESHGMDFNKSHGFLSVAIPDGNGKWSIHTFGKFAHRYPRNKWQQISVIGNTLKGRITCFDENAVYAHRIHAKVSEILTDDQGKKLMCTIRDDIQKGWSNQIIFQLSAENCAYWPQSVMKEVLGDDCPEYFLSPANKATPQDTPLKQIFAWLSRRTEAIQKIVFKILGFLLGAFRKYRTDKGDRSLFNSTFYEDFNLQHPAQLHNYVKAHGGVINYGFLNSPVAY